MTRIVLDVDTFDKLGVGLGDTAQIATEAAVIKVAAMINSRRNRPVSSPMDLASSSPNERTSRRQRKHHNMIPPVSSGQTTIFTSTMVMEESPPMSQKVIAGSLL